MVTFSFESGLIVRTACDVCTTQIGFEMMVVADPKEKNITFS